MKKTWVYSMQHFPIDHRPHLRTVELIRARPHSIARSGGELLRRDTIHDHICYLHSYEDGLLGVPPRYQLLGHSREDRMIWRFEP